MVEVSSRRLPPVILRSWAPWLLAIILPASAGSQAVPLRVGVLSSGPTIDATADWAPWTTAVAAAMGGGERLDLRHLPPEALRAAVLRGELDVVITNPVHYIEIRAEIPLSGVIATMDMDPSQPSSTAFGGVIVRRADTARWATLESLSGARVAYQDGGLLGGYAAPLKRIADAGVTIDGLRLQRVGPPYDRTLQAVLDGDADVGFVRTGVLERWARIGHPGLDDLAVVGRMAIDGFPHVTSTPLYPEWPVVVLPRLDDARGRRFAQAVLALSPGDPALVAARVERITLPADYAPVEALMRDLRLRPFDSPPRLRWRDVWVNRPLAVIGLGVSLLLAVSAAALALRSRRRHKRRAEALREAREASEGEQERVRRILGAVRAGTWEWNVQTGELRVSPHWAESIGFRQEELSPATLETWRSRVHPDDLPIAWAAVQAHLRGDAPNYEARMLMRHRDGRWVPVVDRGEIVVRDAEGRPLWMCGMHINLSDIEPSPARR